MKVIDEQKYFLALMARPGDYIFIDISKLDIATKGYFESLADIDAFTMQVTIQQIMDSIIRANIASEKYLDGTLVIQDNQKHNPLRVLDKTLYNNFQIDIFLKEKVSNKADFNTIMNKFRSISGSQELTNMLSKAIKESDMITFGDILFEKIPYLSLRKFVEYLLDMRSREEKRKNNLELIRDKAA